MGESNITPGVSARIVARSQRQAMDWSLVLASQEIHPVIVPPGESGEWSLLVEPAEYDRALAAIQQYRLENRGWSWRREIPGGTVEIHAGALFWCLFLGFWHWIVTFADPRLYELGKLQSAAVREGAWHLLFTPILLHADLAHLMANLTFGVLVLGFAMARFGPGPTLLCAFLAGALGNVMGITLYSNPYFGVGASGMMMGALGILCTHSVGLWRKSRKAARYIFSGVFAGLLLFVMFGVNPTSDVLAHLGGFLAGLVFGGILSLLPERTLHGTGVNAVLLFVLIGIIALTWTLALR